MAIQLRSDLEEIVRADVERGPYESVDEYLERAVTMLHAQETWLAAYREEIAAKFGNGANSPQQGELFDIDQVKEILQERKQAWTDQWAIRRSPNPDVFRN
jgi:Arc/MetJ-type ribon-helix-helix transcriptional regulator